MASTSTCLRLSAPQLQAVHRRSAALQARSGAAPRPALRHSLVVHAAAAPKGVTQPPRQPTVPPAKFGFVENAEVINSRAAMIGFFGILIVEAIANKGLLELMGIRIGTGLGFEL